MRMFIMFILGLVAKRNRPSPIPEPRMKRLLSRDEILGSAFNPSDVWTTEEILAREG